ncbi:MAG: GNAT family N-acetyltransferase [Usitatibacter sp.]
MPRGQEIGSALYRGVVFETPRLRLRFFELSDAPFVLALVNDPDWIRNIGDRGVRTVDQTRGYLERGPIAMYTRLGFGLYLVELKEGGMPVGMCGLIKRDSLPDVDIGFAFMPAWRGKGYAYEAALASRDYGVLALGLKRIVGITAPDNDASGKLLLKLGFKYEETIPGPSPGELSRLYGYAP